MKDSQLFLKTGLIQIDVDKILIEKLKPSIEYLTYNIRRYNVPVTLVLFYTEIDVSEPLKKSMRLTDIENTIKIGESYFNFVFLPFTDGIDSYTFIKKIENTDLNNIKNFFHFEILEPTIYCYNNLINNFLNGIVDYEKNES